MAKTVNYFSRDFESFKTELINWAKTYFPDQFQYTNDASPDVMYFEACAYVGDVLSYYTDRNFNESFRTTAQARESLVRIANDFGYTQLGRTYDGVANANQVFFGFGRTWNFTMRYNF